MVNPINTKEFKKSETGTKAAWKGFSSQTLYIANRLMLLSEECEFYPERLEDLLVKQNGQIIETVQVKNLSADLSLSHLSPQELDSFFKRSLSLRQKNNELKLTVVSFGPLGDELNGVVTKRPTHIENVKSKLISYNYSTEEAEWILNNLTFQTVNSRELQEQIYNQLKEITETMAAPELAFDVLINHISKLSAVGGKTSKKEWNSRLHNIAMDFAAISGFQQEYGRSIRPLFDYKTYKAAEQLGIEYKLGINAHPDHIRMNLDLKREIWIDRIEKGFMNNQVVIVRGSSGQGKSSLAFRYLIDSFPESNVFLIEHIGNATQAANIVAALSNLSIARDGNLIAYIDVLPYQREWLWIIQQLYKTGSKIKILVTIREEDYRRTVVDKNSISFEDIEVTFSEAEAEWLYDQSITRKFLNFKEAWHKFGEKGPLMEFIYLLNEIESLKEKLGAQINKIIMEEQNSNSWLKVLRLGCLTGRLNINLNLRKTIETTKCENPEKMLYVFEKEYLLRGIKDNKYLEPLHAIRAEILYSILKDTALYPEEGLLVDAIKCVDNYSQMLILNHCYDNPYTSVIVEKIASIYFENWSNYASVIKGILWLEVNDFYRINRNVLLEGDKDFNNAFGFVSLGDTTGLLSDYDFTGISDIMKEINPRGEERLKELKEKLPLKTLNYQYIDRFFELTKEKTPNTLPNEDSEMSDLGYSLFWLSIRGFLIAPLFDSTRVLQHIESTYTDNALDFVVGVHHQGWNEIYNTILPMLQDKICRENKIIIWENSIDKVSTLFIAEVFDEEKAEKASINSQTMHIISAIRRLYPDKQQYAAKVIGLDLVDGIPILDGEKDINSKDLPYEWITQLNGWVNNMNSLEYRPENWDDYVKLIVSNRKFIIETAKIIINSIDHMYKKGGDFSKFTDPNVNKIVNETFKRISVDFSILPKCATDCFGLEGDTQSSKRSTDIMQLEKFRETLRNYRMHFWNFLQQKDALVVSRVKRTEQGQLDHLSLINLVDAVTNMKLFQREFETHFHQFATVEDVNYLNAEECKNLELLLEAWQFMKKSSLQKLDSVAYSCKEAIKKRNRKINQFFSHINEFDGVINVSAPITKMNGDIDLYIAVDFNCVDDFIKTLYRVFKSTFPEATPKTVDNLYICSHISNLIIIALFNGSPTMGALKVKTNDLIYYDEEKFMRYITPTKLDEYIKNSYIVPVEGVPWYHWSSATANIGVLPLLLKHFEKVFNYLLSLPPDTFVNDEIILKWCSDGEVVLSKLISVVSNDVKVLSEHLNEVEELKEYFSNTREILDAFEESKSSIVRTPDKSQIYSIVDNINSFIYNLLTYFQIKLNI